MKKRDTEKYTYLAVGFFTALLAIVLLNFASFPGYPNAYMMPMARMMIGNARSIDCSNLDGNDLEKIGEEIMAQMIGDEKLHEQMDAQMKDEKTMHILMARMMTGCR